MGDTGFSRLLPSRSKTLPRKLGGLAAVYGEPLVLYFAHADGAEQCAVGVADGNVRSEGLETVESLIERFVSDGPLVELRPDDSAG